MAAPTIDPNHRPLVDVPMLDSLSEGQRIWVCQSGSWRPGVVLHSSPRAATVRYRPAEGVGTAVDTVTGYYLAVRDDVDPFVDSLTEELPQAARR